MTFKQKIQLAFYAVIFSVVLLAGGATAIIYIVGETGEHFTP